MTQYIVGFEVRSEGTLESLLDLLDGWQSVRLVGRTLWLISHSATAANVKESLSSIIGDDGSCAVIQVDPGADWAKWPAAEGGPL